MTNVFYFLLLFLSGMVLATSSTITENANSASAQDGAVKDFVEDESINLAGTLFNLFLTKTMGLEGNQQYGCSIEITNNMKQRYLVNPRILLKTGFTKVPPALRIGASNAKGASNTIVFEADDPLIAGFASIGVLSYEIRTSQVDQNATVLYIFWKVTKSRSVFDIKWINLVGIDKNGWQTELKNQLTPFINSNVYKAGSVGQYIENKIGVDILVRGHMTNSKKAKMVVSIEDSGLISIAFKRDFGISLAIGLASTGLNILSNRLINYFTASRVLVVTLENLSTDLVLEQPVWHMSGIEINDPMPWQIAQQQFNQLTLTVSFASGDTFWKKFSSAVFLLSFQIKGTQQRIAFAVKWPKKLSSETFHVYTVFMLSNTQNIAEILKKIATAIQSKETEEKADQVLRKGNNPVITEQVLTDSNRVLVPYVKADKFQQYYSWLYALSDPLVNRVLKVATFVGSKEKATGMSIYFENTQGNSVPSKSNPITGYVEL